MRWRWFSVVLLFSLTTADMYTEDLIITKLPSGHFLSQFAFSITSDLDNSGREYELFPRVIAELISQYDVKELSLSLGMGRWSAEEWGIPPQPSAPTGAYIHAWIQGNETEVDGKWQRVVNSLNGIICTSLTRIFPTLTSSPQLLASASGSYGDDFKFRYAALAKESVCTENLTPWRKLLPCKQNGITTLLNPLKLYSSLFHSMSLKIVPDNEKKTQNLTLSLNLISPTPSRRTEIDIEALFGRKVVGTCRAAERSSIWIESPDDIEVPPGSKRRGKYIVVDVNDDLSARSPRIDMPTDQLPSPSPYISITSKIGGADSYTGSMITIITNSGSSTKASFIHTIPWFVQMHYHTLNLRCESAQSSIKPEIYKHLFTPAISREKPAVIEYDFEIPSKSQCFIEFHFKKAFLRLREYPPDASHGMYIPSAILNIQCVHVAYPGSDVDILTKHNNAPITIHGNVLLVVLPVPDFSMPFNVICLVLTTITFCFSPIHNFSTKMFIPLNSNLPKTPKYRNILTLSVLILLVFAIYAQYYEMGMNEMRRVIEKNIGKLIESFEKMNNL